MAVIIQEDYASFELTRVLKQKGYPLVKVVKDNGDKPLFYDLPKDHPNWNDCDAWYTPTLYDTLALKAHSFRGGMKTQTDASR